MNSKPQENAQRPKLPRHNEQRGLVIMSALLNFVDWLDAEARASSRRGVSLLPVSQPERGQLVKRFLAAHSDGKNYFMQADDIALRLAEPFQNESGEE